MATELQLAFIPIHAYAFTVMRTQGAPHSNPLIDP